MNNGEGPAFFRWWFNQRDTFVFWWCCCRSCNLEQMKDWKSGKR